MSPQASESPPLTDFRAFLDSRNARYKLCHFSASHTEEQIAIEVSRLGLGLLQAVLLEPRGKDPILGLIPSGLTVQLEEFAKRLGVPGIAVLGREEIRRRYPSVDPASGIPPFQLGPDAEIFLSPLIGQHRT